MADVSSRAPSAPGFDPLGNPTPMGEADGASSRSYARHSTGGMATSGRASTIPTDWDGQQLDWYQWLNAQWKQPGADGARASGAATTGMERLDIPGTLAPVNLSNAGSFASLSQWQLHQASTSATNGPAAQGLFRPQRSRSSAGSYARASTPSSVVGAAPGGLARDGHMHHPAVAMERRRAPSPEPSWKGNRRRGKALAPLRDSKHSRRVSQPLSQSGPVHAPPPSPGAAGALSAGADGLPASAPAPKPQRRRLGTRSMTQANMVGGRERSGTWNATRSTSGPNAPGRPTSASGPAFDADYETQIQRKAECNKLIEEGEALLKQFAVEAPLVDTDKDDSEEEDEEASLNFLQRASAAFQKAMAIDGNNFKARSGLKRAEGLATLERRKARKVKGLQLLKKVAQDRGYGSDWRRVLDMEQEQSDKDLKQIFDMIDDDGSGLLDREEVALLMEFFSGEDEVSEKEIDKAMGDMDDDGSGEVDFPEFLEWWKNRGQKSPKAVVAEETREVTKEPTGPEVRAMPGALVVA